MRVCVCACMHIHICPLHCKQICRLLEWDSEKKVSYCIENKTTAVGIGVDLGSEPKQRQTQIAGISRTMGVHVYVSGKNPNTSKHNIGL